MQKTGHSRPTAPAEQPASTTYQLTPLIEWNESFSVNVSEIDRQHQKLIALYNKLHEAMSRGKGNEVLERVFDELLDYTKTHFKTEERYFQAINYAGTNGHIMEHEAFVKKLSELSEKFHAGKAFLTVETLAFMRNWLNEHIKGTDKQYTRCFNEHGIY
ncbi:MAG: bacteriohemerythrin [Gammaproteobacteria bacterium]|jgi:hemerythrin|nr:bacteriohemerythrin [Gammaproteobacteria bacterium]